jgi:transposase
MHTITVGVDLAKQVFQLHGVNEQGKRVLTARVCRDQFMEQFINKPAMLVGMEACGGAHHWAREIAKLGHEVRLMPPHRVQPYIQGNKNDRNDARGICEAVTRPGMTFVPIKSEEQQDVLAWHAMRERRVESRTAMINQLRGLLSEFGRVAPQGTEKARSMMNEILEQESGKWSAKRMSLLREFQAEWKEHDDRIAVLDQEIAAWVKANPVCQRILEIKGVGMLGASALVASVGDLSSFKNARQFAAYLGLTPRERQSGNHRVMGGLTKRGNVYLRGLLIHGARSVLWRLTKPEAGGRLSRWLKGMLERRGYNVTVCALANKNARIIWAMMARGTEYRVTA